MSARPVSGVRYVLVQAEVSAEQVVYEGFAHTSDADVPMSVQVALPGGAVRAAVGRRGLSDAQGPMMSPERAADLTRVAAALVRAATKAEIAAGLALPRKIARWRG